MELENNSHGIRDYSNKAVLAPMVRVGTLPFRLLALDYGADIVWSEEIIAFKLKKGTRIVNKEYNLIDFVENGDPKRKIFSTCKLDHPNVLQLGAADAVTALEAASIASRDVDGIDLNMGCPKHFSVQGGMGASLLCKPEIATDILSTLKRNLNNSITCKIRLLDSVEKTIDLMRILEKTGISAITVHTRFVHERPRDPAHWDWMQLAVAQSALNIPIIVNGDVFRHEDIAKVKEQTKASSVMIARGAMWNCSIFRPETEDIDAVVTKYLKKVVEVGNSYSNAKYVTQQMLLGQEPRHRHDDAVNRCKDMNTLLKLWDLHDYPQQISKKIENSDEVKELTLEEKPPKKQK